MICPESAWETVQKGAHGRHVYTKALLAYAFVLAGNQDKRNEILKSLDGEEVEKGEHICEDFSLCPHPLDGNRREY
jgi:hypothetical protein